MITYIRGKPDAVDALFTALRDLGYKASFMKRHCEESASFAGRLPNDLATLVLSSPDFFDYDRREGELPPMLGL